MLIVAWLKRQLDVVAASARLEALVPCPVPVSIKHGGRGGNHTGMWTYKAFMANATTYHSRQRGTVT